MKMLVLILIVVLERFRFDFHYLYCHLNLSFSQLDVPDLSNQVIKFFKKHEKVVAEVKAENLNSRKSNLKNASTKKYCLFQCEKRQRCP